ncbi:fructokinase [Paracoccus thiocyanatus]|uniref:Fructokinase n=1 Tax=Paracoccus thiocyanatus TaxID=34006 RepID=A0A1N6ZQK6_9RHOB|nr:AAA family ATPase [Paracoccus thiocyanatus]SIR29173.1 fructokinase [Paracoccus thiocyanatus]
MEEILDRIAGLGPGRRLVAIAGPPGSGKSTLAAALVAALEDAVLVPMDGFHLDNDLLDRDGLRACKGAPQTFDAAGLVVLVQRLKAGMDVVYPIFDRPRDQAIAGAGRVGAGDRLVVIEGNYLLLDRAPWRDLAGLWDLSVMLDVPKEELRRRLTARWQGLGRSPAEVSAHLENDLANAALVLRESRPADLRVRPAPISWAGTP